MPKVALLFQSYRVCEQGNTLAQIVAGTGHALEGVAMALSSFTDAATAASRRLSIAAGSTLSGRA